MPNDADLLNDLSNRTNLLLSYQRFNECSDFLDTVQNL